jgi:cell division protein FtsQ
MTDMDIQTNQNKRKLVVLSLFAVILLIRLMLMVVSSKDIFPINNLKIEAPYHFISRHHIQRILQPYLNQSFLVFSEKNLMTDIKKISWTESVRVKKVWPDHVIVQILERNPVAIYNNMLLSEKGDLFKPLKMKKFSVYPRFYGPKTQQKDILHIYEKLSKLLKTQDLFISAIHLRENQAWDITLNTGVKLRLGKQDIEQRLNRFVQVYPRLFAARFDQIVSIDLRYPNGIAVSWKKQEDQINSNPKNNMG